MLCVPMPFTPYKQAAALWKTDSVLVPTPGDPTLDAEDVAVLRTPGDPGGVFFQDPDAATTVNFDPRKTRLAAPPMPDDLLTMRPRTQYAPQGPVLMQALVLDVARTCVCSAGALLCSITPYSLGALLVTKRNCIRVRRALQAAGIVQASPALAALDDTGLACACAAFGGDAVLFVALVAYATKFSDAPAVAQVNPALTVANLTAAFVHERLGAIRAQVTSAAIANYARAETNRAYLTPLPDVVTLTPLDPNAVQQCVDDRALGRALTDPASTPQRRQELACLTGLPLNGGCGGTWYPADVFAAAAPHK